ncbi:MAG: Tex-like N-terminal domain-containing protein [Gemmataceae bacterium]
MTASDSKPELTHPLPETAESNPGTESAASATPPEGVPHDEGANAPVPAAEAVASDSTPAETKAPAVVAQPVPEVPPAPAPMDLSRMAQDFQIRKGQVDAVAHLIEEGNSVPYIARYAKEKTGGLPEEIVRRIADRIAEIKAFADRKRTILKSIATHGKLTDALTAEILAADHPRWLEDLYQPFKPKKKSLAVEARLRGWGPLAEAIWTNDPAVADLATVVAGMIDPDTTFTTSDDILTGVKHILAELISDSAAVRGPVRAFAWDTGTFVTSKVETLPEDKGREYREFFEFNEPVRALTPHRYLAAIRGERDKAIVTKFIFDLTKAKDVAVAQMAMLEGHAHRDYLITCIEDAIGRLLFPSLEREIRKELTERGHEQLAVNFARNLRSLLLQPPVGGKRILAIDPGLRTGCKLAAIDEKGEVLEYDVIYPHTPQKRVAHAKKKLEYLIRKHGLNTVAIGNGTGCRDTEHLISDLIAEFADRRINPRPVVSEATPPIAPIVAPTHAVESHTTPPVAAESMETPAAPAVTPAGEVPISSPIFTMPLDHGDSTVVATSIGGEASVVTTETAAGSAVTSSSNAGAETPAAAAPPPEPEIDLTGLPEAPADLCYTMVNEAGAVGYANGASAKEEFPSLDPVTRSAISIGRRVQDPLAEYVKIDPLQIGPTFHPHDGRPKRLRELLEGVVESCVNHVGVDVNSAGIYLLRNVSGLNPLLAREIVSYRTANGPFTSLEQLKSVPNMTEQKFKQCVGFLRIGKGTEPLDETTVHPERYPLAVKLLTGLGFSTADIADPSKRSAIDAAFRSANAEEWSRTLEVPVPAVIEMMTALANPGYDPRMELPAPVFKTGVLKLEDLKTGMELMGTVLNVVPFGAFVDIGLRESGLVHISQMANRYVKSPFDLVAVGDVVPVWVVEIKSEEKKVSLTMIPPNSVRTHSHDERPPRAERHERGERSVSGERQDRGDRPARPAQPPRPASQQQQHHQRDERPQGGERHSGPPRPKRFAEPGAWRRGGQSAQQQKPASPQADAPAAAAPASSTPSKKQRAKPVVTLSGEQKTGKAALNSFGQLFAFIKERSEGGQAEGTGNASGESKKPGE